ncbi:hypothetical protein KIL84_018766 [Mauremys mutica]|uniref:Uncharacterized protein n=1 Tax=Mauremys mutica TaxID=74926 RepID=A0A9D3XUA9_9SAUR|nr:hypothetical protein KIL84_018766 [Mauremys mutica]
MGSGGGGTSLAARTPRACSSRRLPAAPRRSPLRPPREGSNLLPVQGGHKGRGIAASPARSPGGGGTIRLPGPPASRAPLLPKAPSSSETVGRVLSSLATQWSPLFPSPPGLGGMAGENKGRIWRAHH